MKEKTKQIEHLKKVEKELREQLDNGKRQVQKEIESGHTPNPHGLAKEVEEVLPREIKKVQDSLNKLRNSL